jgi:hypothetical protein
MPAGIKCILELFPDVIKILLKPLLGVHSTHMQTGIFYFETSE